MLVISVSCPPTQTVYTHWLGSSTKSCAVLFVQYSNQGWPFESKDNPSPVVPIDGDDNEGQDLIEDDKTAKTKAAWVVVVEETQGRPASRQLILDDYDFWFQELANQDVRFRLFDDDDMACQSHMHRAKASGIESPFVMIVDDRGGVKAVAPFPGSVEEIRKLIE